MLNRSFFLAVSVCIAASLAALGQSQGAEYLFQLPGTANSGVFVPYNALADPLVPLASTSGPNDISAILPKPDGSKFYLVGPSSIQSVDPTFQDFHTINLTEQSGLTPVPYAAKLTPNGEYLLIATSDSSNNCYLYIVNTSSDQALTGTGLPIQLQGLPGPYVQGSPACPTCWITFSRDSSTAYVIENSIFGGNTLVAQYNLSTFQLVNTPLSIAGAANSLTLSPSNLLYYAGGNQIRVIDPVAWAVTQTIPLSGFNPGPLEFTPDGTVAYAIHQVPRQGGPSSILALTVASGNISYWPPVNASTTGPQFSAVYVAGNTNCPSGHCAFALSPGFTTAYDITPPTATGGLSAATSATVNTAISPTAATNTLAAAISKEIPQANYLYILLGESLFAVNINSDTIASSALSPPLQSGSMIVESFPGQGTVSQILMYNNGQTVNPGSTSVPLVARLIGSNGLPVYNAAGTFSAPSGSGLTVNTPSVTSNGDGYVVTSVSVPTAGSSCSNGTCTITLSIGGATAGFSITVPGTSSTGPGSGSGSSSNQFTITSGQGQAVPVDNAAPNLLSVLVTDANGNPLPNISVSFTVSSGSGLVESASTYEGGSAVTSTTDNTGTASVYYFAAAVNSAYTFETDTIVASATVGSNTFSATFYETAYLTENSTGESGLQATILALDTTTGQYTNPDGLTLTVSPSSPITNAIQAVIVSVPLYGTTSVPVPNVGMTFVNTLYPTEPAPVSCQGNPLSDATGTLNCTLTTSCAATAGTYGIGIQIGAIALQNTTVVVQTGAVTPATVTATSGNNQSGNAGQKAALPLLATVTSACGSPVIGTTVTWAVTSGSATVQQASNTTNILGQASNVVTFGSTAGPVVITATAGTVSVKFTLTNNVVVSKFTALSGGGQTALEGQAFAQPLIVSVVDNNGNPVSGLPVTFSVTTGAATLNPGTATTGSNGQAQTTVTAGSTAGALVVSAAASGFTATFNLTVTPPGPSITASSFLNAASDAPGLVACGLAIVTGSGLASGVQGVISGSNGFGPLPYTLSGVSMSINGVPAPIQAVSNQNGVQQVNFQTPCEVAGSSSATVVLSISGSTTTITGVPVLQAQPGIFSYAGPNNAPYAVIISAQNGEYVTPSNPAVRGQNYYVVVTGLGQTTPPMLTNNVSVAGQTVATTMVVGVGNQGVPVLSASAYIDTFGAYLIEFQIPTTATPGTNIPFAVAALINGNLVFGNNTYLPALQ